MKKNSLYGLLNYLVESEQDNLFESCGKLTLATTKEGKNYYRIDFKNSINTTSYELKNAHLSIFEYYDSSNPSLSAAHFTAFYQVDEREYRLHLFLDENERLLAAPHWHKLIDGKYVAKPLSEGGENLCSALLDQGLRVFQRLRQNQQKAILDLSNQYEKHMVIASELSRDLPANKEEYMQAVASSINHIEKLARISSNLRWPRLVNFLRRLSINVEKMALKASENEGSSSSTAMSVNRQQKETNKAETSSHSRRTKGNDPELPKAPVKQNDQWLRFKSNAKHYLALKDKSDATPLLISLLNQLDVVLLEEKINLSEHSEFSLIERELVKQANRSLSMAIIKGDYEAVKWLYRYSEGNCFDKMNFALQFKNFDLVRFLINELNFPVLTYPVDVRGRQYLNLLEYCYEHAYETPQLIELFSNLVMQGANLMVSIRPNGLPLAHLILQAEPKHPLVDVLNKHAGKTIANKKFYQQLIQSCECYKQSANLSEDEAKKLNAAIEQYRYNLDISQCDEGLFSLKALESKLAVADVVSSIFGDALIKQLQNDKDIREQSAILSAQARKVIQEVRRFNQKHKGRGFCFSNLVEQEFNALKDELLRSNLEFSLDFFTLKDEVLENIDRLMNLYNNISELLSVQEQILRTPQRLGGRNRALKQNLQKEKELIKFIQMESEALTPSMQLRDTSELMNNLKQMASLLGKLGQFANIPPASLIDRKGEEEMLSIERLLSTILPDMDDEDSAHDVEQSSPT